MNDMLSIFNGYLFVARKSRLELEKLFNTNFEFQSSEYVNC